MQFPQIVQDEILVKAEYLDAEPIAVTTLRTAQSGQ
jgi:hypothetical protein